MTDRERRDEPPEFTGHVPTSVKQNHEELKKTKAERREAEARADRAESLLTESGPEAKREIMERVERRVHQNMKDAPSDITLDEKVSAAIAVGVAEGLAEYEYLQQEQGESL